jgi:hypothetical protein
MTGLEVARARNLSPTLIVECAGHCTNKFPLGEGYPFPVMRPGYDHPVMGFFCSPHCYLVLLQPYNCCGMA